MTRRKAFAKWVSRLSILTWCQKYKNKHMISYQGLSLLSLIIQWRIRNQSILTTLTIVTAQPTEFQCWVGPQVLCFSSPLNPVWKINLTTATLICLVLDSKNRPQVYQKQTLVTWTSTLSAFLIIFLLVIIKPFLLLVSLDKTSVLNIEGLLILLHKRLKKLTKRKLHWKLNYKCQKNLMNELKQQNKIKKKSSLIKNLRINDLAVMRMMNPMCMPDPVKNYNLQLN